MQILEQAQKVKQASRVLAGIKPQQLNEAILLVAQQLEENVDAIVAANQKDMENGRNARIPSARLDRLLLDASRIKSMAEDARRVAQLPDVLGGFTGFVRPNGLKVTKRTVPLGVVGMIYESRPNVTVDAAVLCLKSGNAVLLRGGKEAAHSNQALVVLLKQALTKAGLPADAIELVQDPAREVALQMMKLSDHLDLLIPRGGAHLIQAVKEHATVPMIETGTGNCHLYVHEEADLKMALEILLNAKVQRPSVCNACETLLVDEAIAQAFLPLAQSALEAQQVELRGCDKTRQIIAIKEATQLDFDTEYNDLILAIKVVQNVEEALAHIDAYGTQHSEAIVTKSQAVAQQFLQLVDAACVYHNASTRFSDGSEMGFGAEIGISTQKLHARGPFALRELTTYKYVMEGTGQVR